MVRGANDFFLVQEHTKALNTLMNNNAPMVKKRQVMRLSFGDYRTKMVEEEKKAKSNSYFKLLSSITLTFISRSFHENQLKGAK